MVSVNSIRKLVSEDSTVDERVQNRCIESATEIVRNYTRRMILPDELNCIVLDIATLLYQRRQASSATDPIKYSGLFNRDIVKLLDEWRLDNNADDIDD